MTVPTWAERPSWAEELLQAVESAFEVTGTDTPRWPDPHQGRSPEEEEYSRVSDPGKFEILVTRLNAWDVVLAERGLALLEVSNDAAGAWLSAPPSDRDVLWVRRLQPRVFDGCALLWARTIVDGVPFGFDVGLAAPSRPTVLLHTVPYCGCDACDSGSEELLDIVDSIVLTGARGGVIHARSEDRTITAGIDGWSGTNHAPESWLDVTVEPSASVTRWAGQPWL